MPLKSLLQLLFLTATLTLYSCKTYTLSKKEASYYSIDSTTTEDPAILALIAPYKKDLDAEMNQIIGNAAVDMEKAQPESGLGNFAADAILDIARQQFDQTIDCAVSNHGGLRIPVLAKGPITKGSMFELMPFDNMLVVMELDGNETLHFFNHIAKKGGWPISKEIQMGIENGAATKVTIANQAIDPNHTYRILISDYMANGGDDCVFFEGKTRYDLGILFRDALLQYVEQQEAKGKTISAVVEGRVLAND